MVQNKTLPWGEFGYFLELMHIILYTPELLMDNILTALDHFSNAFGESHIRSKEHS